VTESIAVIGDVHGNVSALAGLLRIAEGRFDQFVLVGDYVNRGPNSAGVIQLLIDRIDASVPLFCIAGNHDKAFLKCIEEGKLNAFLRMGGAATINSYIATPEPDILGQVRRSIPGRHVDFLRGLKSHFDENGLLVTHGPKDAHNGSNTVSLHVFGHVPQGQRPKVTRNWAAIDTGCGMTPEGRLTCLVWPTLEILQVDFEGREVRPNAS